MFIWKAPSCFSHQQLLVCSHNFSVHLNLNIAHWLFFFAIKGFVFGEPKRLKMIKVQIYPDCEVLVNDEDAYLLNTYEWYVKKWKSKSYPRITLHKPQKYDLYIHHFVMKDVREGCSYYFLDRNTLNLQKENIMVLLYSTKSHVCNISPSNKTSKYRSIYFSSGKFIAQIRFNRENNT